MSIPRGQLEGVSRAMQGTFICVAWSNGRWRVSESGPRNSIACFGERQDAVAYATELAQKTRDCCLQVQKRELDPDDERDSETEPSGRTTAGARSRPPARRLTGRS